MAKKRDFPGNPEPGTPEYYEAWKAWRASFPQGKEEEAYAKWITQQARLRQLVRGRSSPDEIDPLAWNDYLDSLRSSTIPGWRKEGKKLRKRTPPQILHPNIIASRRQWLMNEAKKQEVSSQDVAVPEPMIVKPRRARFATDWDGGYGESEPVLSAPGRQLETVVPKNAEAIRSWKVEKDQQQKLVLKAMEVRGFAEQNEGLGNIIPGRTVAREVPIQKVGRDTRPVKFGNRYHSVGPDYSPLNTLRISTEGEPLNVAWGTSQLGQFDIERWLAGGQDPGEFLSRILGRNLTGVDQIGKKDKERLRLWFAEQWQTEANQDRGGLYEGTKDLIMRSSIGPYMKGILTEYADKVDAKRMKFIHRLDSVNEEITGIQDRLAAYETGGPAVGSKERKRLGMLFKRKSGLLANIRNLPYNAGAEADVRPLLRDYQAQREDVLARLNADLDAPVMGKDGRLIYKEEAAKRVFLNLSEQQAKIADEGRRAERKIQDIYSLGDRPIIAANGRRIGAAVDILEYVNMDGIHRDRFGNIVKDAIGAVKVSNVAGGPVLGQASNIGIRYRPVGLAGLGDLSEPGSHGDISFRLISGQEPPLPTELLNIYKRNADSQQMLSLARVQGARLKGAPTSTLENAIQRVDELQTRAIRRAIGGVSLEPGRAYGDMDERAKEAYGLMVHGPKVDPVAIGEKYVAGKLETIWQDTPREFTAQQVAAELIGAVHLSPRDYEKRKQYSEAFSHVMRGTDEVSAQARSILGEVVGLTDQEGEELTYKDFKKFIANIEENAVSDKIGIASHFQARRAKIWAENKRMQTRESTVLETLSGPGPGKPGILSSDAGGDPEPYMRWEENISAATQHEFSVAENMADLQLEIDTASNDQGFIDFVKDQLERRERNYLKLEKAKNELRVAEDSGKKTLSIRRQIGLINRDIDKLAVDFRGATKLQRDVIEEAWRKTAPVRLLKLHANLRIPIIRSDFTNQDYRIASELMKKKKGLRTLRRFAQVKLDEAEIDVFANRHRAIVDIRRAHYDKVQKIKGFEEDLTARRELLEPHLASLKGWWERQREVDSFDPTLPFKKHFSQFGDITQEFFQDVRQQYLLDPDFTRTMWEAAQGKRNNPFAGLNETETFHNLVGLENMNFGVELPEFSANYRRLTGEADKGLTLSMSNIEMLNRPDLRMGSQAEIEELHKKGIKPKNIAVTFQFPEEMSPEDRISNYAAIHLQQTMEAWRANPETERLAELGPDGMLTPEAIRAAKSQAHLSIAAGQAEFNLPNEFEWYNPSLHPDEIAWRATRTEEETAHQFDRLHSKYLDKYTRALIDKGMEEEDAPALATQYANNIIAAMRDYGDSIADSRQNVGGMFRPKRNTELMDEYQSIGSFHLVGDNLAAYPGPNRVTSKRHARNLSVADHFNNWVNKEKVTKAGMKGSTKRAIRLTDPRHMPIVNNTRLSEADFAQEIRSIDKGLRERGLSWQMVKEVSETFGDVRGQSYYLGSKSHLGEAEREAAKKALGFEAIPGKLNQWEVNELHNPMAMGDFVHIPGLGEYKKEKGMRLGQLFGLNVRHTQMTQKELIERGRQFKLDVTGWDKFDKPKIRRLLKEQSGGLINIDPSVTRDLLVEHLASRTQAIIDPTGPVQAVMDESHKERIGRVVTRWQNRVNDIAPKTAHEIYAEAEAIEKKAREADTGHKQLNFQTIKAGWEASKSFKIGAVGAAAIATVGGIAILRGRRSKPDHTADDINGEPYQPGGNPYDGGPNYPNQNYSTNVSSAEPMPGMDYVVRANGDFDPNQFRSDVNGITGTRSDGSTYNARKLPAYNDGNMDETMRQYGG